MISFQCDLCGDVQSSDANMAGFTASMTTQAIDHTTEIKLAQKHVCKWCARKIARAFKDREAKRCSSA